jgi:hypothetical protein
VARLLQKRKRQRPQKQRAAGDIQRIFTRDSLHKGAIMNSIASRISARSSTNLHRHSLKGSAINDRRAPKMVPRTVLYTDPLAKAYAEHQEMKNKAMVVDPKVIAATPKVISSILAEPWKVVTVPESELAALKTMHYHGLEYGKSLFNIAPQRPPSNTNPYDANTLPLEDQLQSRKPGEGIFANVATGPYGQREYKYLYLIDFAGMHIIREMTPCEESSRGIPLHSMIKLRGVVGGEIFFDDQNPRVAYVNFGSARFTFQDSVEAENASKFILSLGYDKIVAVYQGRDFSKAPYGMKDRYGEKLANAVFVRESL